MSVLSTNCETCNQYKRQTENTEDYIYRYNSKHPIEHSAPSKTFYYKYQSSKTPAPFFFFGESINQVTLINKVKSI